MSDRGNHVKQEAIQIDCIKGLQEIKDKSVKVVVTSPPYNLRTKYKTYKDNRKDYLVWMGNVFLEIYRVLKDDGHFFLQVGGVNLSPIIPWLVLQKALKNKFILQNEIIWVKNISIHDNSFGQFKPINSQRYLNNTHEFIFHLTKTGNVSINRLRIGVPLKYKCNLKRWNHAENKRCRGNVWFIPYDTIQSKEDRDNHPAIFPVSLSLMCLKLADVTVGDLVIDPFVGTGTTLLGCRKLGVDGIGFDIDICSAKKILKLS